MATRTMVATDNFNRADGGLGANYTTLDGTLSISSNKVVGGGAGTNLSMHTATLSNDQYARGVIGDVFAVQSGYGTRLASLRGYIWRGSAFGRIFVRLDSDESFTTLAFLGGGFSAGQEISHESEGSTHRLYSDGPGTSQVGSDVTDGTYGSGGAGPYVDSTGGASDDFECGNLGTPPAGGSRRVRRMMTLGVH